MALLGGDDGGDTGGDGGRFLFLWDSFLFLTSAVGFLGGVSYGRGGFFGMIKPLDD